MAENMYEYAVVRNQIKEMLGRYPGDLDSIPPKDAKKVIRLLAVERIELEAQEEELREGRIAAEESWRRYKELFDCAPVAYLIFNERGIIKEANVAAGQLLGVDQGFLIGTPFSAYLCSSFNAFHVHMREVFGAESPGACKVTVKRKDGSLLPARLDSNSFVDGDCRVMRSVLTEWGVPSAREIRELIDSDGLIRPDLGELLDECEAFQKTGILKPSEE